MKIKTMVMDLVNINPNINDVYYDIDSYNKAIDKFVKSDIGPFIVNSQPDCSDSDSYTINLKDIIGTVRSIDLKKRRATLSIDIKYANTYNQDEYFCGFMLIGKKSGSKEDPVEIYEITYAYLIPKAGYNKYPISESKT